jgi:hypothetical protein
MQHYAHFLTYGEGAKKNWKSLTLSTQFGIRILHDIPLVGDPTKLSDKSHLKVITCFRLRIKYPEFLIFDIQQIFIGSTRIHARQKQNEQRSIQEHNFKINRKKTHINIHRINVK